VKPRTRALVTAALLVVVLAALVYAFRAVDTRPLPQVQPTRDIEVPTRPVHVIAATPTP